MCKQALKSSAHKYTDNQKKVSDGHTKETDISTALCGQKLKETSPEMSGAITSNRWRIEGYEKQIMQVIFYLKHLQSQTRTITEGD